MEGGANKLRGPARVRPFEWKLRASRTFRPTVVLLPRLRVTVLTRAPRMRRRCRGCGRASLDLRVTASSPHRPHDLATATMAMLAVRAAATPPPRPGPAATGTARAPKPPGLPAS